MGSPESHDGYPESGDAQPSGNAVNVIALHRDSGERFVFLYDPESYDTLLETIDRFVNDPELELTDSEAGVLREKARELWAKDLGETRNRIKGLMGKGE